MPDAPTTPEHNLRTCIGCRRKAAAAEMIRFALDENGVLSVDYRGVAPGRGAWICPDPRCLQQAVKRNAFKRSFRRRVSYDPVSLPGEVSQGLTFRVEAAFRSARRAAALTENTACTPNDQTLMNGQRVHKKSATIGSSEPTALTVSWGNPLTEWVISNTVWGERVARAIKQAHTWESRTSELGPMATRNGRQKRGS
ncbi:MAG: YlxR family protein [Myxococcota bacterium]|nr:YlxR family protein [Myxococcota bacterium]